MEQSIRDLPYTPDKVLDSKSEPAIKLSTNLNRLLRKNNLTQTAAARKCQMSKSTLHSYCNGIVPRQLLKLKIEEKFNPRDVKDYGEMTVEDLVILFQSKHPEANFSASQVYVRDFIETFGKTKIGELSTEAARFWMDAVKLENNLKEISMRGIKSDLEVFFRFLVEKEIISESPLKPIYFKKHTPDVLSRNLLTPEQIEELLSSVKDFSPGYLYPLVKIFAETAAKPTEVFELMWKHIDLEKREITFPKGEKNQERTLAISEELCQIILKKKKAGQNLVFITYYQEPFTKNKIAALVNEFKAKSFCKIKWTSMDIRHSFAVNFLLQGGELRQLQYILGHENVFDTKKLYGAITKAKAQVTTESPFEIGSR